MNNPNRQYQFNKMYYNYIIDCLAQDNLIEELCYVQVAVDTGIRSKEMAMLKWGQFDFDKLLDVKRAKVISSYGDSYGDMSLSRSTSLKICEFREMINPNDTPIFRNIIFRNVPIIADSIKKSIGDDKFTLHDLRRMSVVFEFELLEVINEKESKIYE